MEISIKRVYEEPKPDDGFRILVDRLWPRGLAKENAKIDVWFKSIAPSTELRKWFGHDPQKWLAFKRSYFAELDANKDALNDLLGYVRQYKVTLLYAAKDPACNHALVLKEYLATALS